MTQSYSHNNIFHFFAGDGVKSRLGFFRGWEDGGMCIGFLFFKN